MTLGCIERGDPSQGAFSHDTGEGWRLGPRLQAKEGHYHDAIYNKHNTVKVMIFDDLGGATSGTAKTIKGLAKNASEKGARDATDYGETHTKCFYQHATPPPCHSRACKAQPCHSLRASRISSAQPRMIVGRSTATTVYRG